MKKSIFLLTLLISLLSSAQADLKKVLYPNSEDVNTDAVIIYKDGKVLFEKYSRGYSKNTKHLSWSTAKTISGILIGIAVEDGLIAYSDKVKKYLPEFQTNAMIKDLLQMSSGLKFKEQYSGVPINADVVKMLYLDGANQGIEKFTSSLGTRAVKPGKHFYYSSGDTNILMAVLQKVMNKEQYNNYPWEKFFNKLDINATFEQDSQGLFVGSSYIYMSARDFLKVGKLLNNDGAYRSHQIVPMHILNMMKEVAPGVQLNAAAGTSTRRAYSAQVTTNRPIEGRSLPSQYYDLPEDALLLIGHQGQYIIASPSQNLVIVRLGMDKGRSFELQKFLTATKKLINGSGLKYEVVQKSAFNYKEKKFESSQDYFEYRKIPRLMQRMMAKEFCSCLFITKRPKKLCVKDLKISLPVLPLTFRMKNGVSSFYHSLFPSFSEYTGERFGCKL